MLYEVITIYFLFPVKSYSQGFYVQGYVVTNNNDTLYGYVKDRDPAPYGSIYNKVRFKDNPKAFFAKKYSPDRITSYNVCYTKLLRCIFMLSL